jgi:hypothetical protein
MSVVKDMSPSRLSLHRLGLAPVRLTEPPSDLFAHASSKLAGSISTDIERQSAWPIVEERTIANGGPQIIGAAAAESLVVATIGVTPAETKRRLASAEAVA